MPALAPVPPLPEVTVALDDLIPPGYRHYFNRRPDRPYYSTRRYDFPGRPGFLPLVRAFLDTCAAEHDRDYRYLFTLLGSELATNAIAHSRSGRPGGSYSLVVRRGIGGLTLTCRDDGTVPPGVLTTARDDAPLRPEPLGIEKARGRGLAMVAVLASAWGDNGRASYRHVWFHLAYDLTGSAWNAS
ncbi:ATP-binding protein [Nocardiopsis potens]|uniref:ATP-binding protein n=1 Tax=Nocardiopsis potens TaxID=1246458 RepID=UPI00034C52E2|nr:ATP-binding protein [Nocardiopsis potens]